MEEEIDKIKESIVSFLEKYGDNVNLIFFVSDTDEYKIVLNVNDENDLLDALDLIEDKYIQSSQEHLGTLNEDYWNDRGISLN